MSVVDHVIAAVAAFGAGGVNALAGGGTLISFPVLVALGVPPVAANATNTVALSPGYLGGSIAQRALIEEQSGRVRQLGVVAAVGGVTGSVLLVSTSNDTFRALIPVLLFGAALLLATQDRLKAALGIGAKTDSSAPSRWLAAPVFALGVYGGFFGAGLGIMLLAVLGLVIHERMDRLNALKQVLSLIINVAAALFLVTSGKVDWSFAAVMAVSSLAGGMLGGRLTGRVKPKQLRAIVVTVGFVVAIVYAIRVWF